MVSMAILAACGDSDSGTSTAASEPLPEGIVKTVSELGACNKAGETQQVLATGSYYRCENGEWVEFGWERVPRPSTKKVHPPNSTKIPVPAKIRQTHQLTDPPPRMTRIPVPAPLKVPLPKKTMKFKFLFRQSPD